MSATIDNLTESESPKSAPTRANTGKYAALNQEQKAELKRLHKRSGSAALRQQLNNVAGLGLCAVSILLWREQMWIPLVVCWLVQGHFFHTKPLSLHDASHGTLDSNRRRNGMFGILCGTASLVPLSVYRHAHAFHHGFMSSERDPELWPFNKPGTPWIVRFVCAVLEIFGGFLYTPLLFFRSLFVCGRVKKSVMKRVIAEYALIVLFWGSVLGIIFWQGWEMEFLVGFGVPYAFAGMFQTLNKYTEHMGLFGDTVLSGTRTVIPRDSVNHTLSNMMQHVDHHGTHHRYAQIPFYSLPDASQIVYGDDNPKNPVYRSYAAAFFAMLPSLINPKVGSQWLEKSPQS